MTTDLFALLAIVFLSVTLVATLTAYVRLQKKARRLQDEEDVIKAKAHHRAQEILDTAQDAAFQIANDALVRADENRKLVQDKIEDIAGKQLREYQKMVHAASTNIETEVAKNIEIKMDEAFKQAEVEIAAYKGEKEKQIDHQAEEAVKKATREIIGSSLDSTAHAALVLQALTDAKKEYGF